MKNIFYKKIFPIVSGFIVSSAVMMIFEYTNSKVYPFPEGFDTNNIEQVRQFAKEMPWQAYILVLLGWTIGGFIGGFTAEKISREEKFKNGLILAILLGIAGFTNYLMIMDFILFYIVAIPLMMYSVYMGWKAAKK